MHSLKAKQLPTRYGRFTALGDADLWMQMGYRRCPANGQGEVLALKEKGRRTALKPSSLKRQTTVLKSCVRLVLPAHSPATMVAEVSKPNQFTPCIVSIATEILFLSSIPYHGVSGLKALNSFHVFLQCLCHNLQDCSPGHQGRIS